MVRRNQTYKIIVQHKNQGVASIRPTHASKEMEKSIHKKFIEEQPAPSNFKLKRFREGIDPKTSTARGDNPFMI